MLSQIRNGVCQEIMPPHTRTHTDPSTGALPRELGRLLRSVAANTRSVLAVLHAYSDNLEERYRDEVFRLELCDFIRQATSRVDDSLERLQQFDLQSRGPRSGVDVSALLSNLLDRRWDDLMERDALVLKEIDPLLAPLPIDRARLGRALDMVLSAVIRGVASGGDVHVAARPAGAEARAIDPILVFRFPVDRNIQGIEQLCETRTAQSLLRGLGGALRVHMAPDAVATMVVALSSGAPRS